MPMLSVRRLLMTTSVRILQTGKKKSAAVPLPDNHQADTSRTVPRAKAAVCLRESNTIYRIFWYIGNSDVEWGVGKCGKGEVGGGEKGGGR